MTNLVRPIVVSSTDDRVYILGVTDSDTYYRLWLSSHVISALISICFRKVSQCNDEWFALWRRLEFEIYEQTLRYERMKFEIAQQFDCYEKNIAQNPTYARDEKTLKKAILSLVRHLARLLLRSPPCAFWASFATLCLWWLHRCYFCFVRLIDRVFTYVLFLAIKHLWTGPPVP